LIVIGPLALLVIGAAACAGGDRRSQGGGTGGPPDHVAASPVVDCAGPSPSPSSTFRPPPTTDPTFWQTQARLDELATRVEALAKLFPDVYAGVALEQEYARLAVYRVPSAAFDTALRRELPGAPLRIVDAAHSSRELNALLDRVLADRAYWEGQGIALNELSPLYDGSCVQVGTQDVDTARRLFRLRYGPEAPIRIVPAEPAKAL
jgi:hypothetical protein